MGNQCICYNDSTDQNIKDLSNNNNNNNVNQQNNENQYENGTKLDEDIKNDNNSNYNILSEKKQYTFRKNEKVSAEDITKLNKIIRGHLFRKKFIDGKKKQELENFREELYNKFIQKSKNEKVENTLKENSNLLSTTWEEFYDDDPMEEINIEISKIKKYEKGLIFNSENKELQNLDLSPEKIIENTNSVYKGEINIITGEKIGKGELIYKNGSKIKGTFYKNKPYGWNIYINEEGILYIGLFKNGYLNGKGIRFQKNHNLLYKGDFINNLREGEGIEKGNGGKYEGSFENDKRSGKGKIYFDSGDYYEGDFSDNKFNGTGHFIWKKNGHEYIGDYLNGIIHGNGLYKWNKDQYYKGQYINGVKEGNGEMKYADGKKFICPFKNGKPDGIGNFIDPKGKEKEVQFIDGKINKDYKGSKNDN